MWGIGGLHKFLFVLFTAPIIALGVILIIHLLMCAIERYDFRATYGTPYPKTLTAQRRKIRLMAFLQKVKGLFQ